MGHKTLYIIVKIFSFILITFIIYKGYRNYRSKIISKSISLSILTGLMFLFVADIVFIRNFGRAPVGIEAGRFFSIFLLGVLSLVMFKRARVSSHYVFITACFFLLLGQGLLLLKNDSMLWWTGVVLHLQAYSLLVYTSLMKPVEFRHKRETTWLANLIAQQNKIHERDSVIQKEMTIKINTLNELFIHERHKVDKINILSEVSKSIGSLDDRDRILELLPEKISTIWQAQYCMIFLNECDQNLFNLYYSYGMDEYIKEIRFSKGEGIPGWVGLEGKPVRLNNPYHDPRFKNKYDINVLSMLVVPLKVANKVIGVIELINKLEGEFTEEDEYLLSNLASQLAVTLENAGKFEKNRNVYFDTIRALVNAIEARDPYTKGHSIQTTKYAVDIARRLCLSQQEIEDIQHAASLHDIGKIGIKETILKKPHKLNIDEYAEVKNHPFTGAQIIKPIKTLERIVPLVYHHHERFDGAGYMDGLRGDDIPLGSRIIAVADAFEAMTSDRPYRKGLGREVSISQLQSGSGVQFDTRIVKAFLMGMK